METPTQRLAAAAHDHSKTMQHYNSPVEQIRRKNLKGDESKYVEGRIKDSAAHVSQVASENASVSKGADPSGRPSPLSTTMGGIKRGK